MNSKFYYKRKAVHTEYSPNILRTFSNIHAYKFLDSSSVLWYMCSTVCICVCVWACQMTRAHTHTHTNSGIHIPKDHPQCLKSRSAHARTCMQICFSNYLQLLKSHEWIFVSNYRWLCRSKGACITEFFFEYFTINGNLMVTDEKTTFTCRNVNIRRMRKLGK